MVHAEFVRAMELIASEEAHGIAVLMVGGGTIRGDYRHNPRNDGLLIIEEYENGCFDHHHERKYTAVAISQIAAIARIEF